MCGTTVIGLDPSLKTATATDTLTGSATAVSGFVCVGWQHGEEGHEEAGDDKMLNKRTSYQ